MQGPVLGYVEADAGVDSSNSHHTQEIYGRGRKPSIHTEASMKSKIANHILDLRLSVKVCTTVGGTKTRVQDRTVLGYIYKEYKHSE